MCAYGRWSCRARSGPPPPPAERAGSRRSKRRLPLRAPAAAARVHQLRSRRLQACFLELSAMTEPSGDVARLGLLLGEDERDRLAAASRTASAPGAVHVVLVLARRIEIDHVRDVVEIEAARRDVGGDECRHLAALEAGERALACSLGHVAVHRDGTDVVPSELL